MKKCEICLKNNNLKRRTCSYDCYMKLLSKTHIGQIPVNLAGLIKNSSKTGFKKGHIGYKGMLGRKQTVEAKKKMSESKIKNPTKYWLGKKRPDVGAKIAKKLKGKKIPYSRRVKLMKVSLKGKDHKWWKGGLTKKNYKIRNSSKLAIWRDKVFIRDNFTCQECKRQGDRLQAHHIKSFADYPEFRFDIKNGLTLCVDCHKKTDTYLKSKI